MAKKKVKKSMTEGTIDLVFTFDTTGSMYPCITQVRRYVSETVGYLFDQIPNLRIGIIAHGDYCDYDDIITVLELTNDKKAIQNFVSTVKNTDGGDLDEAYEFVLNRARTMNWTAGKNKALVMIGDAEPHKVGYQYQKIRNDLDWENEARLLIEAGVTIVPIQALGVRSSNWFYNGLAELSGTPKLELDQFSDINDIVMALCMKRAGKLPQFESRLEKRGGVSYSVLRAVDKLSGRKTAKKPKSKHAVHPSRFQLIYVDDNSPIKQFVQEQGLVFKKGKGFYEFTKPETIQSYKEVVLRDRATGDMFSGDKAREIAGIPIGVSARVKPNILDKYQVFVQSTSYNRKLIGGTQFLYEVPERH